MNKKFLCVIASVLILSVLFMTSCGKKVSVKDDLIKFDQKVTDTITDFKSETKNLGATVNSVDSLVKLKAVMLKTQKKFKEIDVKTKEVKDLKKMLTSSFGKVLEGVNGFIKVSRKYDKALYDKSNKIGQEGSSGMNKFYDKAKKLADKENIKLKMKKFE